MKTSKLEVFILIILVICGFFFRSWRLDTISPDHFDEGVYLFSALGIADRTQPHLFYPDQEKFSPPVFIGLIALMYKLFGGSIDTIGLSVNVFLGTMTIPLLWLIGRRWFGSIAGMVAGILVTFNEFHIVFSRSVLTDVSFSFFFLLSLLLIELSIDRRSYWLALLAGLAVGLAWNTKYHGWFAIVIAGMALALFIWFNREKGKSLYRLIGLFALTSVTALLCYLPWAVYIQSLPGGYRALAAYQRTLINQPLISLRWFKNLLEQFTQQFTLEGTLTRISILLAFLMPALWQKDGTQRKPGFVIRLTLLGLSVLLFGGAVVTLALALLAIPIVLRRKDHFPSWMLLAWLVVFAFSTPFYQPYARLVIPLILACFLATGVWIQAIISRLQRVETDSQLSPALPILITLAVFCLSFLAPDASDPWHEARGIAQAANLIQEAVPGGEPIMVIGEPALALYLHLSGHPSFERMDDPGQWAAITEPTYLVTGVYTSRAPSLRAGIDNIQDRLELVGRFPLNPRIVRILDDFNGSDERNYLVNPSNTYELTLYRLVPAQ